MVGFVLDIEQSTLQPRSNEGDGIAAHDETG
jgi:hypothetical protein